MPHRHLRFASALAALIAAALPVVLHAHPGDLDPNGCHLDYRKGDYHCHQSPGAKEEIAPVKKSSTGICHAPGSQYYKETQNFTPYASMRTCLRSGGRRPK
jgi:hypothetical protein